MANLTDLMLELGGSPGEGPTALPTPEPHAGPASQIDTTIPVYGNPTTASVRANFATAQVEITGLMQNTVGAPFLSLAGGRMGGPMYLYNDPTDVMMPVTLGYLQSTGGGGGSGGGGIPEAPSDGKFYTRSQGAWVPGVALSGGTLAQMTGELLLAGNPADALGAVPKQYADAIGAVANAAVPLAGNAANPMTGLLILSGDPGAPLGAVTKQYADAADNLRAPIANPTFTGIVTAATNGRVIVTGPTNPSVTLYNTTAGQPCYGVYNSGGYLGFGLAVPSTGNPNGSPFATMDQNGNFLFATRVNVTGGRLITSGTSNPSVTMNYTGGSYIWSMWNDNTGWLQIGTADANGTPGSSLTKMDGFGDWQMQGGISCGLNNRGAPQLSVTGGGYTYNFNAVSGNLTIQGSAGGLTINGANGAASFGSSLAVNGALNAGGSTNGLCGGNIVCSIGGINYQGLPYGGHTIGFTWTGTAVNYYVDGGNIGAISDARLKTNFAPVEVDPLNLVNRIPLQQFDWLPREIGGETYQKPHWSCSFTAQDLAKVIPEAIIDGDILSVDPLPMAGYFIGAIQQLAAENTALAARVAALEGTLR